MDDYNYDSDGNSVHNTDEEGNGTSDGDDDNEDYSDLGSHRDVSPHSMGVPLHEDILHVTSIEIRHQINELYLPRSGASSMQYQQLVPANIQELADILIRRFLPRFWFDRTQDPKLSQNRNRPCDNKQPHAHAVLSTCVECGYRFHKQLIYDGPATERQTERDARVKFKADATATFTSASRSEARGGEHSDETMARKVTLKKCKRAPVIKREDRVGPGSSKSPMFSIPRDLSAATVNIQVLNRNRGRLDYDGNLDHVGTKENDHLSLDCPLNRTGLISDTIRPLAAMKVKSKATKLHVGWNVVPGHDFSSLIDPLTRFRYGNTDRQAVYNGLHQSQQRDDRLFLTSVSDQGSNSESFTSYYPTRSLMASFVHLLPRDVQLTTNQLRKLFTYFLWHPWFDSDLQAITLRASYHELWALFLVLDEGPGPSSDDVQNLIISTRRDASKIRKLRIGDRKRKYHQGDHGQKDMEGQPQRKSVNKGGAEMVYDQDQEGRDAETDAEDNVSIESRGIDGHVKKRGRSSRDHTYNQSEIEDIAEDSPTVVDSLSQPPQNGPKSFVGTELARLRSMERRFMTYFEASLRVHNVYIHRRPRASVEIVRHHYNVRNGWVLGGRELVTMTSATPDNNSAKACRKTGLYVATDPIIQIQPSSSLSTSFQISPQTDFDKMPFTFSLRRQFTRSNYDYLAFLSSPRVTY